MSKNINNFSDGQNKNILLIRNFSKLDKEDNDTSNSKIDQQEISDYFCQSCLTEALKNLAGTEASTKMKKIRMKKDVIVIFYHFYYYPIFKHALFSKKSKQA